LICQIDIDRRSEMIISGDEMVKYIFSQ